VKATLNNPELQTLTALRTISAHGSFNKPFSNHSSFNKPVSGNCSFEKLISYDGPVNKPISDHSSFNYKFLIGNFLAARASRHFQQVTNHA
jgi:hypothetical protein